jgi:hypothetical protein
LCSVRLTTPQPKISARVGELEGVGLKVHDSRGMVVPGLDSCGRVCTLCKRMLPWDEFGLDRSKSNGHKSSCKACDSARVLKRYHEQRADVPAPTCEECGVELEGRRRVVCSSRCRERRFRRLNPEAYGTREAAKVERRREARRRAREASTSSSRRNVG